MGVVGGLKVGFEIVGFVVCDGVGRVEVWGNLWGVGVVEGVKVVESLVGVGVKGDWGMKRGLRVGEKMGGVKSWVEVGGVVVWGVVGFRG